MSNRDICDDTYHDRKITDPYTYEFYDVSEYGIRRIAMLQIHYMNVIGGMEVGRTLGRKLKKSELPSDFGDWFTYERFLKKDCYVNILSVDGK
ncbi:MAG: hypothetical protein RPU34_11605 [Candidatus Sedimenticola sp. (ex Thyasira tokunagai)]